jgi:hypothetical protein
MELQVTGSSLPDEANRSAEESGPRRSEGDERLVRLMEEFQRRQSERPELVVRPWWTSGGAGDEEGASRRITGFVVEYCPRGVESAELAIRPNRVRVEGPGGLREAPLDLETGWRLAGQDVSCPRLMTNHLLSMADRLLGEAA